MTTAPDPDPGSGTQPLCGLPPQPPPDLPAHLGGDRIRAIIEGAAIWNNGTTLRYYFFDRETDGSDVVLPDGTRTFVPWRDPGGQRDVVRAAFGEWRDVGIGLDFVEVQNRSEAEIRIGFQQGDGSWATQLGRQLLGEDVDQRSINYGWDLRTTYGRGTALHEIGHALGMPHEHQSPFAGIVWDEAKVYAYLSGPPNRWHHDTIYYNVIRKLSASEVRGSAWDPDSIMEYAFPKGLILKPERYQTQDLRPPGTLSALDRQWILTWYPPMGPQEPPALQPFESRPLSLAPRQQADFVLSPPATRRYQVGTFGRSDVVLTLFEDVDGELRFRAGDDDSGQDRNALIDVKLFQSRRYVVRVRMFYTRASGQTAVMYW